MDVPSASVDPPFRVFAVHGGPGSGKGTLCAVMKEKHSVGHIVHLSVGDVLRAELQKPDSPYAQTIRGNMSEGRVGPPHITVALLKAAMADAIASVVHYSSS
jgi:UMP-CMP kinase